MAPNRFSKDRKPRDVTPFRDDAPASIVPLRPTTPGPHRPESPVDPMSDRPVTPAPPEWTSYDAPINFTWVIPDELCGMGWPKSRDQVRFLVDQGIDHLVTLSPEKIPPHYAFPNLKHTLIPVEDFTGPTISEIQKFIEITDDARKEGEAVGVHCAEGRGRTGVMCACYLIYYYDMEPWDAIRIMRRQRPGSVERKVQEQTVERFYQLLSDYGKESIDRLDQRERQLMETQRKQQAELIRNDALATQRATMNLMNHMHSFHTKQSAEAKQERIARMRRARSMPKLEDEEEKKVMDLKNHLQSFLQGQNRPKRSKSKARGDKDADSNDCSDTDRKSRATTPGRSLLEEVSLKPASERTIKNRLDPPANPEQKSDFKNHFRDFMRTPATVKRGRSFSQPRDKDKGSGKEESCLSRKESFNDKYTAEQEQAKLELENHTKRFLQRKSMIRPIRNSDESDNDSMSVNLSSNKTVDKDSRDEDSRDEDSRDEDSRDSSSEDEIENSSSASNNIVSSKPPCLSAPLDPSDTSKDEFSENGNDFFVNTRKNGDDLFTAEIQNGDDLLTAEIKNGDDLLTDKIKKDDESLIDKRTINGEEKSEKFIQDYREEYKPRYQNNIRTERLRSKSDIVMPSASYDVELDVEQMLEESWGPKCQNGITDIYSAIKTVTEVSEKVEAPRLDVVNGHSDPAKETEENNLQNHTNVIDRPRIRRNNLNSNKEYVYLDTKAKIGNSNPRPFNLSHQTSQDNEERSFSRQNSIDCQDNKQAQEAINSRRQSCNDNEYNNNSRRPSSNVETVERSYSRQYSNENKENKKNGNEKSKSERRRREPKAEEADDNTPTPYENKERKKSLSEKFKSDRRKSEAKAEDADDNTQTPPTTITSRTTEILNACKNDLRRLTYRKTYSRTRSVTVEPDLEKKNKSTENGMLQTHEGSSNASDKYASPTRYTQVSSGSRLPNRPTTPGPYFGIDRPVTPGPYLSKRPNTPGPFARESWKRTNQKFNYTKFNKYGTHETFV
eukprot:GFUD01026468.1.p1 GENE.GFUD01026468.1~~GFUD01026468.1.p1  ORF type:complete len:1011 (+),score=220.73 GFUD01026468.1:495-3527(+)